MHPADCGARFVPLVREALAAVVGGRAGEHLAPGAATTEDGGAAGQTEVGPVLQPAAAAHSALRLIHP